MDVLSKVFRYNDKPVTTKLVGDEILFLLKDVCKVLDLGHVATVKKRLDDDVVSNHPIQDALGRTQIATFVNEDGLYDVILDSRKTEAKAFRKWITSKVLPTIRKTGSFSIEQNESLSVERLSPELQMFKQLWDGMARKELEDAKRDEQIKGLETTVTVIKDTFLHKDDNWRKSISRMLNQAVNSSNYGHQEIRRKSYQLLEERARCNLSVRLQNLKDRLEENGAKATRIKDANKLEVIESDARLKEIYTTIVKELSIGSLV